MSRIPHCIFSYIQYSFHIAILVYTFDHIRRVSLRGCMVLYIACYNAYCSNIVLRKQYYRGITSCYRSMLAIETAFGAFFIGINQLSMRFLPIDSGFGACCIKIRSIAYAVLLYIVFLQPYCLLRFYSPHLHHTSA